MPGFDSNLASRVTKAHPKANEGYEQQQLRWVLDMHGKRYLILLNGKIEPFPLTRFARKHLLLASKTKDATDVGTKVANRREHRRNVGGEARYNFKYGGALASDTAMSTVINLVNQEQYAFVLEESAAERFASAAWDFNSNGQQQQKVRVDFGCACVLTRKVNKAMEAFTKTGSWANLSGRATTGAKGARLIIVEHLDTVP